MKKRLAVLIMIGIVLTQSVMVQAQESTSDEYSVLDIIDMYGQKLDVLEKERSFDELRQVRAERDSLIAKAGGEVHYLTDDSFENLEEELATDFSEIGLSEDYQYTIVINGEGATTRSSAGSSFTYTSGGKTYTMRYFTITASDDPLFAKTGSKNLLSSASTELIRNCLNTMVGAYLSALDKYGVAGTIASLSGLSVSDFSTSKSSQLSYVGGANWTRVYTQIWNSYDQAWQFASCVEKSEAKRS